MARTPMRKGLAFAAKSPLRYSIIAVTLVLYLASTWTSEHDRWPQRGDTPKLAQLGEGGASAALDALFHAVCADRVEEVQRMVRAHEVDVNAFLFHSGQAPAPFYSAAGRKATSSAATAAAPAGKGAFSATALHVAAACAAPRMALWLAKGAHADVRARDARELTPRQVFLAMGERGVGSSSSSTEGDAQQRHRDTLELLSVPCADLREPDLAADVRLQRHLQPRCAGEYLASQEVHQEGSGGGDGGKGSNSEL